MTEVFVVRNQLGHYWGKGKAWVDGSEPKTVMRMKHEDEAINILFELSSRDFELRGEVLAVALTERGEPVIEPSQILLPVEVAQEETTLDGVPAQEPGPAADPGEQPTAEPETPGAP